MELTANPTELLNACADAWKLGNEAQEELIRRTYAAIDRSGYNAGIASAGILDRIRKFFAEELLPAIGRTGKRFEDLCAEVERLVREPAEQLLTTLRSEEFSGLTTQTLIVTAGTADALGDRIERMYAPKLVKAGKPNAVPVMQVDGPKAGKLVFIDMGESVRADGNGRSQRPRGADGKVVPFTLAERRARLQKRRDAFVVKHVHEYLRTLTPEKALEIVSPWTQRRINREAGANVFDPVALLKAFGSTKRADYVDGGDAWKEYDSLRESEPDHEAAAAFLAVAQVWIKRLNIQGGHTVTAQAEDARRMCQILGVDFLALFTEARRAIPQPKSWAEHEEPDPPPVSTEPIDDDDGQANKEPIKTEIETEAVAVAC